MTSLVISASDGHDLDAYVSAPTAPDRGAVVLVQEIFGVNAHIRAQADKFAALGYYTIAPALFDRTVRGLELGYAPDDIQTAIAAKTAASDESALLDIAAAVQHVAVHGPVAVVGYCWGGTLAYLASARLSGIAGAVGYYGAGIPAASNEEPRVPVLLHFGDADHSISVSDVHRFSEQRPEVELYLYPAGHGFNCDARPSFNAEASQAAWQRTALFLQSIFGASQ